jgi:hypothetical protein
MGTKLWHKLAPYVFKDNGIFWGGTWMIFFTFTLCDLQGPYITWSTKAKWVVCKQMEPFVLWQKKVGVFFSFEIIHVLLSLSLDKAEHFGKGSLGYLGEVLRNNTKKIRMLLNYEARKEVPIQQKNVSRT